MDNEINVTGTLVWYYYICKREVWLMAHNITPNQDNEYIDLGRFIHENSYSRDKKEIRFGNTIFDIIREDNDTMLIGEIKKTSKYEKSAKMQLSYYLNILKENGYNAEGLLMIPEEKKNIKITLTSEIEKELNKAIDDIKKIIKMDMPYKAEKCKYCSRCGYNELCFS